jgi:hypothetical protein
VLAVCSAVQCSSVQCTAVQCSAVQCWRWAAGSTPLAGLLRWQETCSYSVGNWRLYTCRFVASNNMVPLHCKEAFPPSAVEIVTSRVSLFPQRLRGLTVTSGLRGEGGKSASGGAGDVKNVLKHRFPADNPANTLALAVSRPGQLIDCTYFITLIYIHNLSMHRRDNAVNTRFPPRPP